MTEGSPPRLRGALSITLLGVSSPGITPAPAGSTKSCGNFGDDTRDHPRACGEHLCWQVLVQCLLGSPPRLRGAQFLPLMRYS